MRRCRCRYINLCVVYTLEKKEWPLQHSAEVVDYSLLRPPVYTWGVCYNASDKICESFGHKVVEDDKGGIVTGEVKEWCSKHEHFSA